MPSNIDIIHNTHKVQHGKLYPYIDRISNITMNGVRNFDVHLFGWESGVRAFHSDMTAIFLNLASGDEMKVASAISSF